MVDWSLIQQPNFVGAALQGYQAGRQMGRERRTDAVLTGFTKDPAGAIQQAAFDPALQANLRERYGQQVYGETVAKTAPAEMQAFARIAPEQYQKMDEMQRKKLAEANDYLGNAAIRIAQLPPAQRAQAWDAAARQGAQVGVAGADKFIGKYSDDNLNALIDVTKHTSEVLDAQRTKIVPLQDGGNYLVQDGQGRILGDGGQFVAPGQGAQMQPTQAASPAGDIPALLGQIAARKSITPQEVQMISSQLGPNGQQAMQGWLKQNGIAVAQDSAPPSQTVNGQTYYQVNGKWYDNPEGR